VGWDGMGMGHVGELGTRVGRSQCKVEGLRMRLELESGCRYG